MPLAMMPDATAEVCLSSEEHIPPDDRPTFIVHFLTGREWLKATELLKKYDAERRDETAAPYLDEVLAMMLVGWRNIKGRDGKELEFTSAADVLTLLEKEDLVIRARKALLLSELEKKASRSQGNSAPAGSAIAASAPANA